MDVFSILKQDHLRVKTDLHSLIRSCEANIEINFDKLDICREDLTMHMDIEEEIFYPRAKEVKEAGSLVKDAYEEHREVRDILAQLDRSLTAEKLGEYLKKIEEEVSHHVEEEENELFPILERAWSSEEILEISNQLMDFKKRANGITR